MKLSDYQQTPKGLVRKGAKVVSVHTPEGQAALRQLAKKARKQS